jgi:p-hydroxybenzoate 3-monooxygenase
VSRTQVGIVGAGPAGLMLAHLLHLEGIDTVVIEDRSREYVEARIRAGVLERGTADLLTETGVGRRMQRDGEIHAGIGIQFDGERHRIDLDALVGKSIVIYGQTEIVKDLIEARLATGRPLLFEVGDVSVSDLETERPRLSFSHEGERDELECDVIAGCDGFHGVCRPSIPAGVLTEFSREYPFGWLGILAAVPPSIDEVCYSAHELGFALLSLRTRELSRYYIQCTPDEDLSLWPDERIWEELQLRVGLEGWTLEEGPILEKGVTGMRSFVVEPMQYGRLFLAGDAAHIVPPTGAKGLNLAIADVALLAPALVALVKEKDPRLADEYSDRALRRVWRCTHFSWWMTTMLHAGEDPFDAQLQLSQLRWVATSVAGATGLAENYAGLPIGF